MRGFEPKVASNIIWSSKNEVDPKKLEMVAVLFEDPNNLLILGVTCAGVFFEGVFVFPSFSLSSLAGSSDPFSSLPNINFFRGEESDCGFVVCFGTRLGLEAGTTVPVPVL